MAKLFIFSVFLTTCLHFSFGQEDYIAIEPRGEQLFVKHGASQQLDCSALGDTTKGPHLTWSEVPTWVGVSAQTTAEASGEETLLKANLTISSFGPEHSGVYTCKLQDSTSTYTRELDLFHVTETKMEPKFHTGNTSVTLGCDVDATDRELMDVKWRKDERDVDLSPESKFSLDGDKNLMISNPKREDMGVYIKRFNFRQTTVPYDCVITYQEEELQVTARKTEAEYFYGNTTGVLACNVNVPAARIKAVEWLKNGTAVSSLKEHSRFEVIKDNYSLIIHDPTRDDADMYTARFTIEGIPEPYNCQVAYRSEPFVLDFDKSKNLIQEDNMELQCKVKGYPKAEVRWFKDNVPLNESTGEDKRIQFKPLNGYKNARLLIRNVDFGDAGEYSCEAYSDYFEASASKRITVRVKDKLAALWPFLGIVGEVVFLCIIIFIYEKRRNKQAEQEDNAAQEIDGPNVDKKEGLRHRNTPGNNTTA